MRRSTSASLAAPARGLEDDGGGRGTKGGPRHSTNMTTLKLFPRWIPSP
jgi:hypothetical protein